MDMPDDKTWTWDSHDGRRRRGGHEGGARLRCGRACSAPTRCSPRTWLRQHGKELFTTEGLGFDAADAQAWFDLMVKCQKAGAIGTPSRSA